MTLPAPAVLAEDTQPALKPAFTRRADKALRVRAAGVSVLAALIAVPVLAVVWTALAGDGGAGNWQALWNTVLPTYIQNTLVIGFGVALLTFLTGVATAWTVTMYAFPGRRFFEVALLLPLAMPAYVVAYAYTDFLDYAGPVQIFLRDMFGWQSPRDYWFPDIRSVGGAIAMMTLAFYPYVYLTARTAFVEQSANLLEAARTLGGGQWESFRRVALPVAWPSIAVGLSLTLMEVISDFGVVQFFAVQTLTTGLFNVWLIMADRAGGAQIALVLLVFVAALLIGERRARIRKGYFALSSTHKRPVRRPLGRAETGAAMLICFLPFAAGFLLPFGLLAQHALGHAGDMLSPDFLSMVSRSLGLAAAASLIVVAAGLGLAYSARLGLNRTARAAIRVANLGYAIPGAVLAIGIMIPFGAFDRLVDDFMRAQFGVSTGLILSGSVAGLLFAYLVRFLTISHGTLESGLGRIRPSLDMAARSLGRTSFRTLTEMHLPLLRGSLLTAALIIFVDVMKELPATLLLRPFDFDTLATTAYSLASDERLNAAALPSLAIALAGLIPVFLLSRAITHARDFETGDETLPSPTS